ncbi:MAG: SBBP repeat-containing protein, partial [Ignavibacteria bacterium]
VYVTGLSLGSGTGIDIVTLKYNPLTGDTIWVTRYNGSGALEDKPTAIVTDNLFVYVTGWSILPSTSRDIVTIKYNALTGVVVWARSHNGNNNGGDYGFSIAVDGSGNVYVTGRSDVLPGAQKYTTLKYDASGNLASGWPSVYTGPLSTIYDEAHSIKIDASGNSYVTGIAGYTTVQDFLTLKINGSGVVQWAKRHNGNQNLEDNAVELVLDGTPNVYACGYSFRFGGVQDYLVIKYSGATGDSLAAATYNNSPVNNIDAITAAAIDASANVYVTGYSIGTSGNFDYLTIKYNSNLAQQWLSRYVGPAGIYLPTSIAVLNGLVFVTGLSQGAGSGYDFLTVKYNADGSQAGTIRDNGSSNGNDYATSIAVDASENVFITGSALFGGPSDYYTIRYSPNPFGIKPISNEIPKEFKLWQNYPNPFNPSTTINFDLPVKAFVNLIVYDVLGREVTALINENLIAGKYELKLDASQLPNITSGVYFYKLNAGEFIDTKKMILLK